MPDTRAPTVPQFTRRLGIETPEHLVLELELAGLGSRMAATVCDAGLLVLAFVLLGLAIQLLPTPTGGDAEGPWSTLAAIVLIGTVFLLFWGYFLLFEALNDGRTPGQRLLRRRGVPPARPAARAAPRPRGRGAAPTHGRARGSVRAAIPAAGPRSRDLPGAAAQHRAGQAPGAPRRPARAGGRPHLRRRGAVRHAEAGGLGNIPHARGTRRAPGVEAARRDRDSGLCGAVSRGRVRSGAGPHLRRGPARARVPGARGERRAQRAVRPAYRTARDRKSTRLNSSHGYISYAVFCLKKKKKIKHKKDKNTRTKATDGCTSNRALQ